MIDKVLLEDSRGESSLSAAPYACFYIKLHNTSESKKYSYETWSGKFINVRPDFAILKDDIGNIYKRLDFGLLKRPALSVKHNDSIYPGKSIIDCLVFEVPVAKAKALYLELPADNLGIGGSFKFHIPIESLRSRSREEDALYAARIAEEKHIKEKNAITTQDRKEKRSKGAFLDGDVYLAKKAETLTALDRETLDAALNGSYYKSTKVRKIDVDDELICLREDGVNLVVRFNGYERWVRKESVKLAREVDPSSPHDEK